jgi:hypothetical protein
VASLKIAARRRFKKKMGLKDRAKRPVDIRANQPGAKQKANPQGLAFVV